MVKENTQSDPRELMIQAKKGNREAFGALYELYFVPIFRYIYLRLQNKEETEDLAQTVFLKVFQKVADYKEQGKDPLAYFFTVARNTVIDYFRKKKELNLDENVLDYNYSYNPKEFTEKSAHKETIRQALKYLTAEQQEVIILKFINDWSNKEMARLLEKSEEAIRQIQCRALKTLRQYFKDLKIL